MPEPWRCWSSSPSPPSRWFPKVLGILLMMAGIGYILTSLTFFVFPAQLKAFRQVMTPFHFG